MKWIYVSSLYGAAVLMLVCFFYSIARPKNNVLEKPIRRLIICVTAAVAVNATAVLMPTRTSALALYGVYHCCVDAMCMALLHYVRRYTGIHFKESSRNENNGYSITGRLYLSSRQSFYRNSI